MSANHHNRPSSSRLRKTSRSLLTACGTNILALPMASRSRFWSTETPFASSNAPYIRSQLRRLCSGRRIPTGSPAPRPFVDATVPAAVLADAIRKGTKNVGRNGSYLVARQLKQNIAAFWQNMDAASTVVIDESGQPASATWLAQKAIGRTQAVICCDAGGTAKGNDMTFFDTDLEGFGCPITSHVRRANPRDFRRRWRHRNPEIAETTDHRGQALGTDKS